MATLSVERRLAAILCADVFGYSRLMGEDELGTVRAFNASREVLDELIRRHHGRVLGGAGDSVLAEFPSAVEAVACAVEIQAAIAGRNADLPENRRMQFRFGLSPVITVIGVIFVVITVITREDPNTPMPAHCRNPSDRTPDCKADGLIDC